MGKYMRKAKITADVVVMEVVSTATHQPSLGVRTRARALALQKPPSTSPSSDPTSYLQLRSRRLEKPPLLASSPPRVAQAKDRTAACKETGKEEGFANFGSAAIRSCCLGGICREEGGFGMVLEQSQDAVSFGENVLEVDSRERTVRETTPCSLILNSEAARTPGSTTRSQTSNLPGRRMQIAGNRSIPTTYEMEEFFAVAEQLQQRRFTEKYNYDPVNDCPLSGRYEWVRLDH